MNMLKLFNQIHNLFLENYTASYAFTELQARLRMQPVWCLACRTESLFRLRNSYVYHFGIVQHYL